MHQCPQCPYEFECEFQVSHHVLRKHTHIYAAELFHAIVEPERFSCICCEFKTYYNWDLYEHCKQQHHGRVDESNMEQSSYCDEEANNYLCNSCRYKSDSSLYLVNHVASCQMMARPSPGDNLDNERSASGSNVIVGGKTKYWHCAKCLFKTNWRCSLRSHHMLIHASSEDIDWFKCAKCSYKAKRKLYLKNHMLTHASSEEIDWFQCAKCSYKAKRKEYLKNHMLTHASSEDIDWFQCAKCLYKAKRRDYLKTHMLIHTSNKDIDWFQCAKCSQKSKRKSDLKTHMLTHTSSEESKKKSHLTDHMLIHATCADVFRFQCAICLLKTKWKNNLKRHMLTHHT